MRIELEVAGHEVDFVSINRSDGVATQDKLVKKCAFPQLQDTEELGIWAQLAGGKDDFYVFDRDGVLHTYLKSFGDIPTNLAEADGYSAVKGAILSAIEGKDPGPEPTDDTRSDAPESNADTTPDGDGGPEPDAEEESTDTAPPVDSQSPDTD